MSSKEGGQSPPYRMTPYQQVEAFVASYKPGEDVLGTLRLIYDRYLEGLRKIEEGDTYYLWRLYADYDCEPYIDYSEDYCVRDEHGDILVEPTIELAKDFLEEEYLHLIQAGFVRTVHRTKRLKEELMAAVWHPRRIERLLELGGEKVLDNFAGV